MSTSLQTTELAASQIKSALATIAAQCDNAHSLDGVGFSKIDKELGKGLANSPIPLNKWTARMINAGYRLCRKYRKQLAANNIDFAQMIDPTPVNEAAEKWAATMSKSSSLPVLPAKACFYQVDVLDATNEHFFLENYGDRLAVAKQENGLICVVTLKGYYVCSISTDEAKACFDYCKDSNGKYIKVTK